MPRKVTDDDEREVCPIHSCPLEDFVSATEEGTEYFTYCPICEEGYNKFLEDQADVEFGGSPEESVTK